MNTPAVDLEARLCATVDRHGLFDGISRLGVALSGGPDSSALLVALARIYGELDIVACHVDHGLHAESGAHARAAARVAEAAGVKCVTVEAPWADIEAAGAARSAPTSVRRGEAEARAARHLALGRIAGDLGLDAVAVAHTRNDRAETLLLNLVRGAGLDGLSSMRPRSAIRFVAEDMGGTSSGPRPAELRLVRPLLEVPGGMTRAYCEERRVGFVVDPTNSDLAISRNRLRHEILPALERIHPGAIANLAKTAAHLDVDRLFIEAQAARESGGLIETGPWWHAFDIEGLAAVPLALASRAVREALRPLLGGQPPSSAAVEAVLAGRGGTPAGSSLESRHEGEMLVVLDGVRRGAHQACKPVEAASGESRRLGEIEFSLGYLPAGTVTVRPVSEGDRVPEMRHTLIDTLGRGGVPRRLRESALCMLEGENPVCAFGPGFCVPREASVEVEATFTTLDR